MTTNYPYYDPYVAYRPAYGEQLPADQQPSPTPPGNKRRRVFVAGVAALAAAALFGGIAVYETRSATVDGNGATAQQVPTNPGTVPTIPGDMNRGGTSTSVGLATDEQEKGVVTIVSVLKYQGAESAGTGMILTSDGEILTNNHVVNGATSITVTVASTGKSYRADVVGTDPSDDVAVLQLRDASGLTTANIGDSSDVQVGDAIVGVGNAGGTGTLRASSGKVTALDQSITATDETGQGGERLTGLIEVAAEIISGDSGGPLYDSSGDVVGMNTAASANRALASTAYAIPIDDAVKIADEIETGVETSKIHIGLPAFLGVSVADDSAVTGAVVSRLLDRGPAAGAGIAEGSVITNVGGTRVTSADSLKSVLRGYDPGDKTTVTWTDSGGSTHTATVTLGSGPAD
jgi:S1-C subfamily serine protease